MVLPNSILGNQWVQWSYLQECGYLKGNCINNKPAQPSSTWVSASWKMPHWKSNLLAIIHRRVSSSTIVYCCVMLRWDLWVLYLSWASWVLYISWTSIDFVYSSLSRRECLSVEEIAILQQFGASFTNKRRQSFHLNMVLV